MYACIGASILTQRKTWMQHCCWGYGVWNDSNRVATDFQQLSRPPSHPNTKKDSTGSLPQIQSIQKNKWHLVILVNKKNVLLAQQNLGTYQSMKNQSDQPINPPETTSCPSICQSIEVIYWTCFCGTSNAHDGYHLSRVSNRSERRFFKRYRNLPPLEKKRRTNI